MAVADTGSFPKFLSGFLVPSGNAGVFAERSDDHDISNDKDALGVAPLGNFGIRVAFVDGDGPVGFFCFAIDAKDFTEGANEINGVFFDGRDAA